MERVELVDLPREQNQDGTDIIEDPDQKSKAPSNRIISLESCDRS